MNTDLSNVVVVVDDHQSTRETLTYVLETSGISVQTGSDGVEGLEAVKRYKPKVVLLDLEMPRMDGYEVCREIRRASDIEEVYVLVLTACGQSRDPVRAMDAGADLHMTKPFDDELLIQVINEVFEGNLVPRHRDNNSDGRPCWLAGTSAHAANSGYSFRSSGRVRCPGLQSPELSR